MKSEDRFVGRKVQYSHDYGIKEVIFMDRSVGITLQNKGEMGKTCINGPLSKNGKDQYYDEMFDAMEKMIDNWYIDLDVLNLIWTNGKQKYESTWGSVSCAVGG